jgi:la-related protein 1
LYEKSLKTPKKPTVEQKLVLQQRPPLSEIKKNSQPVTMSPKRFVTGGLTAASPPVGWLVNQQILSKSFESKSFDKHSNSHSFGGRSHGHSHHSHGHSYNAGRSFGGRSVGKSVDHKEFPPFEHPSYELLKENGFVQQKYSKYHDRAVKGID